MCVRKFEDEIKYRMTPECEARIKRKIREAERRTELEKKEEDLWSKVVRGELTRDEAELIIVKEERDFFNEIGYGETNGMMCYGNDVKTKKSIKLNPDTYCHVLVTGGSGSGKSYGLMFLLGHLMQLYSDTVVYFCDFKNSEDFQFLSDYEYYYTGDDCYDGLMKYYDSFCRCRKSGERGRRHILIFDEFPAAMSYFTGKDKREKTNKANQMQQAMAEILMMGRGLKYGVWVVTQRADNSLFSNGARDNFMMVIGLGRLSKEQKGMLFSGEEIPEKDYKQGEGIMLADGKALTEIYFPEMKNMPKWRFYTRMGMEDSSVYESRDTF